MTRSESKFQQTLIRDIKKLFEGCVVIKNDPNYLQGIPDLLILFGKRWAMLECKIDAKAKHQPNQDFYLRHFGKMSFAALIHPDNKDQVLHDLQQAFGTGRKARVSQRQ